MKHIATLGWFFILATGGGASYSTLGPFPSLRVCNATAAKLVWPKGVCVMPPGTHFDANGTLLDDYDSQPHPGGADCPPEATVAKPCWKNK